jgi:CRP/FNR family transcriptional regulator
MADNPQTFNARLSHIWESPNFFSLVAAIKRPPVSIKKGRILFSDGDVLERLHYIQEGFVKLYRVSEEGKETISYLYGPGYVVGLRALLSKDKIAKHNAEALTDLKVISISHGEYFDIVSKYPAFIIDLTHYFMDRLESTERTIEGFIATDVATRVAYFLLDFATRFSKTTKSQAVILPLPLTHQRIAEFIGSSREAVTLSIQRLEKDGVLTIEKGKVTINKLLKLQKYAQINKKTNQGSSS